MPTANARFDGVMGTDYPLTTKARPHYGVMESYLAKYIKGLKLKPEAKIVDVGCGYGRTSRMVRSVSPQAHITAVDNEPRMIEKAMKYLAADVVGIVKQGAVEYLKTVPPASLDLVVSVFVVHNMQAEYRKKLFAQIYRVLKPGGVYASVDKIAQNKDAEHKVSLTWQLNSALHAFVPAGRFDLYQDFVNHFYEDDQPKMLMRESDAKNLLKKSGLVNIEMTHRKYMDIMLTARKPARRKK